MLLAFAIGAGYSLTLDFHEPRVQHKIAYHLTTLPAASGAELAPGYYQQPPAAPVNPLPPRPEHPDRLV